MQKWGEVRKIELNPNLVTLMSPEDKQALEHHAREIAKILHRNTPVETITTLEGIEKTVRGEILEHVSPEIGIFLSNKLQASIGEGNVES